MNTNLKPVFVLLTRSNTIMSKLVYTFTHDKYTHASIALDVKLDKIYSYGRKMTDDTGDSFANSGFVVDSIDNSFYNSPMPYALYVTFLPERNVKLLEKKLNEFINAKQTSFNFAGVVRYKFGLNPKDKDPMKLFCSQFVSEVLRASKLDLTNNVQPEYIKPMDYTSNDNFILIDSGFCNMYKPKKVEKKLETIKKLFITKNFAAMKIAEAYFNNEAIDFDMVMEAFLE